MSLTFFQANGPDVCALGTLDPQKPALNPCFPGYDSQCS